jgi:hypothetical protein
MRRFDTRATAGAFLFACASVMANGIAIPASILRAALDDAERRTGAPSGALKVISQEPVVWPDASLGCPRPGVNYTQALVKGYRIRIGTPGGELDFHASATGKLVLCPASRSADPLPDDKR